MKRLIVSAVLSVVAILGLAIETQANGGLFRRHRDGCDSGCHSAPCGDACAPAACAPVAPAPVQYVEQKVTRYKQEISWKEVEVVVHKQVITPEKFTYTVQVPQFKPEVRKETYYETVRNEVEYKYNVLVPRTVEKTVKQTYVECVRETVVEKVPVCRTIRVNYTDECGRCCVRCERVTEMVDVTRCIVKRVPTVRDVVVRETVCDTEVRVGKRIECNLVQKTRDVTVNVCSFVTENREGTRNVCTTVAEKVKQKVQVCELKAYEEVVRVAVNAPCATDCGYSNDCCDNGGHRRGGLFRRCR